MFYNIKKKFARSGIVLNFVKNMNKKCSMDNNRILLDAEWPDMPSFEEGIRRAPDRGYTLTPEKTRTALKNALR